MLVTAAFLMYAAGWLCKCLDLTCAWRAMWVWGSLAMPAVDLRPSVTAKQLTSHAVSWLDAQDRRSSLIVRVFPASAAN